MRGRVERHGRGGRYWVELEPEVATGRRRMATKGGFATQREAQEALHRLLAASGDRTLTAGPSRRLAEYVPEWLEMATVDPKPTSAASYRHAVTKLCKALGSVRLADLTPMMVERATPGYQALTWIRESKSVHTESFR